MVRMLFVVEYYSLVITVEGNTVFGFIEWNIVVIMNVITPTFRNFFIQVQAVL